MTPRDPDFEAMKDITRLSWRLDFDAIAPAGNETALLPPGEALPS